MEAKRGGLTSTAQSSTRQRAEGAFLPSDSSGPSVCRGRARSVSNLYVVRLLYIRFAQAAAATCNLQIRDGCTLARSTKSRETSITVIPGTVRLHSSRTHLQAGLRNALRPKTSEQSVRGLGRSDRLLVAGEEPPLGSHLVTPRRGFSHHGIYVGRGNVVHHKSTVGRLLRGPVEEVSLARFALGRAIWIRVHASPRFSGAEVARRALSRVGEDRYRLLTNNCEHFCEWCVQDERRSFQVEHLLSLPRQLTHADGAAASRLPRVSGALKLLICVLSASPPAAARNPWPAVSDCRPFSFLLSSRQQRKSARPTSQVYVTEGRN